MIRKLRTFALGCGRKLLGPVRSQMYAWIDYRVGLAEERLAAARFGRMRARDAAGAEREVAFEDVVPALLNAISSANAAAREGRRREIALGVRVEALEAEIGAMRAKRPGRDEGLRAA